MSSAAGNIDITENIKFGQVGDYVLLGDVYRPAGAEKLPGVVIAHGGGFIVGFKTQGGLVEYAKDLAAEGYVVFSVDYRLLKDNGTHPKSTADVNCAIRWFKANADTYSVDKERVAILGPSAGGYLALMAGFTSGAPFELSQAECPSGDEDSTVLAIVDYYGITDMKIMHDGMAKTLARNFMGKKFKDAPELYREASPVSHFRSAPPTLIFHGTSDHQVPIAHSRKIAKLMKEAGLPVWLFEYRGKDHGFVFFTDQFPGGTAYGIARDFLNVHLKGTPACPEKTDNPFNCGE